MPNPKTWLPVAALLALPCSFFRTAHQELDNGSWEQLKGCEHFYVRTDYEGWSTLGFARYWWQEPSVLLTGFLDFRPRGKYVLAHEAENNRCFLVEVKSTSAVNAEAPLISTIDCSIMSENESKQTNQLTAHH